ncbi:MAG: PDZ domain-containing protein [Planctomycetota bacterium]
MSRQSWMTNGTVDSIRPVARKAASEAWPRVGFLFVCFAFLGMNHAVFAQSDSTPSWLRERMAIRVSPRRDSPEMLRLVRPVTERLRGSVVSVICGERTVSLGTVVDARSARSGFTISGAQTGYGTELSPNVHFVVTKRSELTSDPIRVRLADGRMLPARIGSVRKRSDLALLVLRADSPASVDSLQPVVFATEVPAIGDFLVTPGRSGRVAGLGVTGTRPLRVEHEVRLGVMFRTEPTVGALINRVYPGSGAARAGVQLGDRIVAIDGQQHSNSDMVRATLKDMFPGDVVQLTIERDGNTLDVQARLQDLSMLQESENDARVNGPRNARLSGFDSVIQHDTVLSPQQCGGPVLSLQGQVVGLNIARAGRVVSYALPASLVANEVAGMISEARTE